MPVKSAEGIPRALQFVILAVELALFVGAGVVMFIAGHRPGIRAIGVSMALASVALVRLTNVTIGSVFRRKAVDARENTSRPPDGLDP